MKYSVIPIRTVAQSLESENGVKNKWYFEHNAARENGLHILVNRFFLFLFVQSKEYKRCFIACSSTFGACVTFFYFFWKKVFERVFSSFIYFHRLCNSSSFKWCHNCSVRSVERERKKIAGSQLSRKKMPKLLNLCLLSLSVSLSLSLMHTHTLTFQHSRFHIFTLFLSALSFIVEHSPLSPSSLLFSHSFDQLYP